MDIFMVSKLIEIHCDRAEKEGWQDKIGRVSGFMDEAQQVARWGKDEGKETEGGVMEESVIVD